MNWWNASPLSAACGAANWIDWRFPEKPLDVLAQQIVASVASEDCDEEKLFDLDAFGLAVSRSDARGI